MEVHPDFSELLKLFKDFHVEYVIVGGCALAFHGAPRYAGDIDLLVSTAPVNAERIMAALDAFGFGNSNLKASDFTEQGRFVRLGHPLVRIDILTSISGVSWEEAFANSVSGNYGGVDVAIIGREEFLLNKRASGELRILQRSRHLVVSELMPLPNKRVESLPLLARTALRRPNFVATKSVPLKAAAHAKR